MRKQRAKDRVAVIRETIEYIVRFRATDAEVNGPDDLFTLIDAQAPDAARTASVLEREIVELDMVRSSGRCAHG